jgi:hypothetical protein
VQPKVQKVIIKPTDVKIPASLQEIYDVPDSERCAIDPTPRNQGKGVLAKFNANINDVRSGYDCQVAELKHT